MKTATSRRTTTVRNVPSSLGVINRLVQLLVEDKTESGIEARPERRSHTIEGHETRQAGARHASKRRRNGVESNHKLGDDQGFCAVAGKKPFGTRRIGIRRLTKSGE